MVQNADCGLADQQRYNLRTKNVDVVRVRTLYPLPAQPIQLERKCMHLNSAYCCLLPSPRRYRR